MLAGAGFGDDAALAHAAGEEALADDIVDFVRAGVGAVFALEPKARTAEGVGEAFGEVERGGAAGVVAEHGAEVGHESGVGFGGGPRGFNVEEGGHEGFADEAAAVGAEVAGGVGVLADEFVHRGRGFRVRGSGSWSESGGAWRGLGREDFFRVLAARKPTGIFSAWTLRGRPLADTSPARVVREAPPSENLPVIFA